MDVAPKEDAFNQESPLCDCDCDCEEHVSEWGEICPKCEKNCEDPDAGDPTTKPWYIEPGYEPFAADD